METHKGSCPKKKCRFWDFVPTGGGGPSEHPPCPNLYFENAWKLWGQIMFNIIKIKKKMYYLGPISIIVFILDFYMWRLSFLGIFFLPQTLRPKFA